MRIAIWLFVTIIIVAIVIGWGGAYMLPMKKSEDNGSDTK